MAIMQPNQPAKAAGISLGLDSFVEGGGLWDDFDGTIREAVFTEFDYNGSTDPVLALALEIFNEDEPEDLTQIEGGGTKNPFIQYYGAGDLKFFRPSADGKEIVPVGGKTGLSKSCNTFHLLSSMVTAGLPADKIGSRVDVLEGQRFHFLRKAIERTMRKDKNDKKSKDKETKKSEALLAEKWLGEAGSKTTTGPKGPATPGPVAKAPMPPTRATGPAPVVTTPTAAPPPTTPPPPSAGFPPEAVDIAQTYIIEVLAANNNTAPKAGLAGGFLGWAKTAGPNGTPLAMATRNKAIQALGNDEFLSRTDLGWSFDGANLTLG